MYHTQEKRAVKLCKPILCKKDYAWLGDAYYFWYNETDAIHWGNNSKKGTGYYEIYKASIDTKNILDTVFNEEHYNFWIKQIEKAAKKISINTGEKATLKEINDYFRERSNWADITNGIMFQDLPNSEDLLVVGLFYRKRIQLAVFDLIIINNFTFHYESKCI